MPEPLAPKTISLSNSSGFTLVEVMVAMGLVIISLLGLLQVAGLATSANMTNQLRDEAVLLGEDHLAELIRLPQASVPVFQTLSAVSRTRGSSKKFMVTRSSTPIPAVNPTSNLLAVHVDWSYKSVPYYHEVKAMRTYTDGK